MSRQPQGQTGIDSGTCPVAGAPPRLQLVVTHPSYLRERLKEFFFSELFDFPDGVDSSPHTQQMVVPISVKRLEAPTHLPNQVHGSLHPVTDPLPTPSFYY